MTSTQQSATRTGGIGVKEVVAIVGVLLAVAAGSIATYWVRSKGEEASAGTRSAAVPPAETPKQVGSTAPAPRDAEAIHSDVYFDFKSTRLRADAARVLQEDVALMEKESAWVVLVQGYSDQQGPAEYNKVLALRRAEAVKHFLVDLGVPETAIKVVTIGQDGSLCDEPTRECQQLNRRVHIEMRRLARAAGPTSPTSADGAGTPETPATSRP